MPRDSKEQLMRATMDAIRAFQAAVDEVDEQVARRAGINRTDLRCLDHLTRGGSLTAGELAEAAGLTTGAMTLAIDRLERAGLARRLRDPQDRRRVWVEATKKSERLVEALYGEVGREGRRHLNRMSASALRTVTEFLQAARAINEEHAARLRATGSSRPAAGRRGPARAT